MAVLGVTPDKSYEDTVTLSDDLRYSIEVVDFQKCPSPSQPRGLGVAPAMCIYSDKNSEAMSGRPPQHGEFDVDRRFDRVAISSVLWQCAGCTCRCQHEGSLDYSVQGQPEFCRGYGWQLSYSMQ